MKPNKYNIIYLYLIFGFCVVFITCSNISFGHTIQWNKENPKSSFNESLNNMERYSKKHFPKVRKHLNFLKIHHNWRPENISQIGIRIIYYKHGVKTFESLEYEPKQLANAKCKTEDKFAFILHGWRQSCDTEWVHKLIERLTFHRGGCIVCIDYSDVAQSSYMRLYRNFKVISDTIASRILNLVNEGFDPRKGYIFGFSFGGQIATDIGRKLRPEHVFKSIDTCDMAGPGFDLVADVDHREAAEHVQCLHSSRDKGTRIYACHQNVRLGNCGYSQPAVVSQPYYSSHGLCVQIYINAFDYPFYAMQNKPEWCISLKPVINVPNGFTIGYNENPNLNILGDIFVPTSLNFPYNLSEKELLFLQLVSSEQDTLR